MVELGALHTMAARQARMATLRGKGQSGNWPGGGWRMGGGTWQFCSALLLTGKPLLFRVFFCESHANSGAFLGKSKQIDPLKNIENVEVVLVK